MNTYKVLLADDEEDVIQVILKKIHWEELGFSVIGYALNGIKALEMAEEMQPDVVVTDIKMPFMDGLELSRKLKKELPATKILIFTGFDQFEYAKEAVHLEIEEYILKPVNAKEMSEIFVRLKASLDREQDQQKNIEKLQNYYMESLPQLQSNFYSTLIEGKIPKDKLRKYFLDYQIPLKGPFYCCVDIHTSSHNVPEYVTPLLLSMSVHKQVQERLKKRWDGVFFSYLGDTIMIAQMDGKEEVAELTDDCDRFAKIALHQLHAVVTCGIGVSCGHPLDIPQSYTGAREAVSYRVLYGTSRAINIREIAPSETGYLLISEDSHLHNLFKKISMGDRPMIEEAVNQYFEKVFSAVRRVGHYHILLMELVSGLYRFGTDNDIEFSDLIKDQKNFFIELQEMDQKTFKKWVTDVGLCFHDRLSELRKNNSKSYVKEAQKYVRENYADSEMSLDKVCSTLGVSNSYFSSVFKKETGQAFVTYLTNYRMELASRMLIETQDKNYIIGLRVGYTDANYFSYVFKKQFGMSPQKYRINHK